MGIHHTWRECGYTTLTEQTGQYSRYVAVQPCSVGSEKRIETMNAEEKHQIERQHIFAVNNSPDFLDILRELLQEEHYNVTTTAFAPDTFDQIAAVQPDLVIVDLALGEQVGRDLLHELAAGARTTHIPVIVVSTSSDLLEKAREQSERTGGNWFMGKPMDLDDLLGAISALIGRS